MKAVQIVRAGIAELIDLDRPACGPDEVLIKSYAAGVCGSDVELYQGAAGGVRALPCGAWPRVVGRCRGGRRASARH
ncbi:MAG: alcohol dehydrogenase catalytic domain-containing protein [Chloroflexia bacterium]